MTVEDFYESKGIDIGDIVCYSTPKGTEPPIDFCPLQMTKEYLEHLKIAYKCINPNCDNNGTIAVYDMYSDEWEPEQCQYCYENNPKLKQLKQDK